MIFKTLCLCCALSGATAIFAQQSLLTARIEARGSYQYNQENNSRNGFGGDYVMVRLDGQLSDQFSYSFRHRAYKAHKDYSFWDATDWLNFTWKATEAWSFTAGKQIVAIGGWEYDRHPIDLYYSSEAWNNVPCYEWGVTAQYAFNHNKDKILAQFTQTPFRWVAPDMYGYSLLWYGNHGFWNTSYSVNAFEYAPGKYISHIALGNQFVVDKWRFEFDFWNRAADHQVFFFDDFSIIGELSLRAHKMVNVFAKMTYDKNSANNNADLQVLSGTELTQLSGGVEVYPIHGKPDLRLHAVVAHSWGKNSNPQGTILPDDTNVHIGATLRLDLLNLKRK